MEEYWEEERCVSYVLMPGTQMINSTFLGFVYFFFLIYLFLGIQIISDIFMEAIEEITSQTKTVVEKHNGQEFEIEIPIWNPTIANLTLMALGSSAPEILLSIIETV